MIGFRTSGRNPTPSELMGDGLLTIPNVVFHFRYEFAQNRMFVNIIYMYVCNLYLKLSSMVASPLLEFYFICAYSIPIAANFIESNICTTCHAMKLSRQKFLSILGGFSFYFGRAGRVECGTRFLCVNCNIIRRRVTFKITAENDRLDRYYC